MGRAQPAKDLGNAWYAAPDQRWRFSSLYRGARRFPYQATTQLLYPPGVAPEELEAIQEGIPHTLSSVPKTREQLAEALVDRAANPQLRELLLSGWGALLKPFF